MRLITHDELFDRCLEIATATDDSPARNRLMHETLLLACEAATDGGRTGFGNLFSQVDRICRRCGVSERERLEIQLMRRHSNSRDRLAHRELMYDIRALCLFISAVFAVDIPPRLSRIIPHTARPLGDNVRIDARCVRCVVGRVEEDRFYVTADLETGSRVMRSDYGQADRGYDLSSLRTLLREGMQLNLLDCHIEGDTISPQLIVIEPDFLVDISSLAACFTDYGHHEMAYTVNRLRPRANSQAILLGNFAGRALDGIINSAQRFSLNETVMESFRNEALQFCTCPNFSPEVFMRDARQQAENIREAVDVLFGSGEFDIAKAVVEPSFVCEQLGLQGRADLMTTDFRLLVEQKSGKAKWDNMRKTAAPGDGGNAKGAYTEAHYVQLLLYYGVLQHNFGFSHRHTDMRLLYSRYPAVNGLMAVSFYRALFAEAIMLRNRIVAVEFSIARNGFGSITDLLSADVINERHLSGTFFDNYIRPQIESVTAPLHSLSPLERSYFEHMMTFVYREQLASRVGTVNSAAGSVADLWNMPLHEKIETGAILFGEAPLASPQGGKTCGPPLIPPRGEDLRLDTEEAPLLSPQGGNCLRLDTEEATLTSPQGGNCLRLDTEEPPLTSPQGGNCLRLDTGEDTYNNDDIICLRLLPYSSPTSSNGAPPLGGIRGGPQGGSASSTFRRGDMVFLYTYRDTPDLRRSLLHKATIEDIDNDRVVLRLSNPQRNPEIFRGRHFAIEHAAGDVGTTSHLRGLHTLITSPQSRRDLLLGQRAPLADTSIRLSRSYHPHYDGILSEAKQARDYYLLVGPPGTGKTSMALRFLVEEELATTPQDRNGDHTENTPSSNLHQTSVLLLSYTNRAVDEICAMLTDADIPFLRIGNEASCDPRFRDNLLEASLGEKPRLNDISRRISETRVFVGTTSTMQSRPFVFGLKHFSLAIIDEASQILEPAVIGLLAAHDGMGRCHIDRFILVGDHKQLPAVVQQSEDDSRVDDPQLHAIGLTDCRRSLFERLIDIERRSGRSHTVGILRRHGRMHPDVAAFACEMFYAGERLMPVPCPHQEEDTLGYDLPSRDAADDMLKRHRMMFIPSAPCRDESSSDKVNMSEARIVAELTQRIRRFYGEQFDAERTIGIIVPYRNQIAAIRNELIKAGVTEADRISIDTVERYQGSQRDVIIYSFTVQRRSQLAFLTANCFTENGRTIDRKLNVALTRARRQMIMTGNVDVLKENALFAELIRRYRVTKT